MSFNINIDKTSLVDAIASDVCARCGSTGGGITDLDALSIAINNYMIEYGDKGPRYYYRGGWHIFKKDTQDGYPALWIAPWFPWVGQWPTDIKIFVGEVMQVRSLNPGAYLLFFERVRTEATISYVGFYGYSDGTIQFRAYPAGVTQNLGQIQMGDIIGMEMVLKYDAGNNQWQVAAYLQKYDWDADSWSLLGSATAPIEDPDTPFKYIAAFEGNSSAFELALLGFYVKPAPSQAGEPTYTGPGIMAKLRELGLVDPRTITI